MSCAIKKKTPEIAIECEECEDRREKKMIVGKGKDVCASSPTLRQARFCVCICIKSQKSLLMIAGYVCILATSVNFPQF